MLEAIQNEVRGGEKSPRSKGPDRGDMADTEREGALEGW